MPETQLIGTPSTKRTHVDGDNQYTPWLDLLGDRRHGVTALVEGAFTGTPQLEVRAITSDDADVAAAVPLTDNGFDAGVPGVRLISELVGSFQIRLGFPAGQAASDAVVQISGQ